MGYYTRYELSQIKNEIPDSYLADEIAKDEQANYALDSYGESRQTCKWYDHEAFMLKLSSQYPKTVFRLHGEGEESGDVWHKYYKNGQQIFHDSLADYKLKEPDYNAL